MTIPEAAQLVMQTGAMAGGSCTADGASKGIGAGVSIDISGNSEAEVYVLNMGCNPPVHN